MPGLDLGKTGRASVWSRTTLLSVCVLSVLGKEGMSFNIGDAQEGPGMTQCWLSMGPPSFGFQNHLCVFPQTLMSNSTYPKRNLEELSRFFIEFYQRHYLFPLHSNKPPSVGYLCSTDEKILSL